MLGVVTWSTAPGGGLTSPQWCSDSRLSMRQQEGDHVRVVSGDIVIAWGQEASVRDQRAVGLVLFVRLHPSNLEVIVIGS